MRARRDPASGQIELSENDTPVLQYNYAPVQPGLVLASIAEPNLKYAVARSDYIHPLYGPHGESLTKDWSKDHPHHRGIYWAWPEVDWRGQRGDLHALQKVFARPTGKCDLISGPVFAQVQAENLWQWEDREPMVRELGTIRAFRSTGTGRTIDLIFRFEALAGPVLVARRGAAHYGGLNLRLNEVRGQQITKHTDPESVNPRKAWSDLSGRFGGASQPAGVTVIQHAGNPAYPGDWIEYPELNWLQPTFPAAGTRYEITADKPLVLRFRLLIHPAHPFQNPWLPLIGRLRTPPIQPSGNIQESFMNNHTPTPLTRREFLKTTGAAATAALAIPAIVPGSALGKNGATAPSERINLGIIGCGGMALRI